MPLRFLPFKFGAAIHDHLGTDALRTAANAAGTSASTLSRLINGQMPDVETLLTVCGWMGRSPMEFVIDTDTQPPYNACAACPPIAFVRHR